MTALLLPESGLLFHLNPGPWNPFLLSNERRAISFILDRNGEIVENGRGLGDGKEKFPVRGARAERWQFP